MNHQHGRHGALNRVVDGHEGKISGFPSLPRGQVKTKDCLCQIVADFPLKPNIYIYITYIHAYSIIL
jgi:hypothetical protein